MKSYFTTQARYYDTHDVPGYPAPGCCCRSPNRPYPCTTMARNYKRYLILIFIPYLFLIVIFHTQLQVYDSGTKVIEEEGAFIERKHRQEYRNGSSVFSGSAKKQETSRRVQFHKKSIENGVIFVAVRNRLEAGSKRNDSVNNSVERKEDSFESNTNAVINDADDHGKLPIMQTQRDGQGGELPEPNNPFVYVGVNNSNSTWRNSVYPLSQECKDSPVSKHIPYVQFQPLLSHWVYTAYYDARGPGPPTVRVILLLRRIDPSDFYCHFPSSSGKFASSSDDFITVIPSFYEMCENHGKDYGGWIMSCEVPLDIEKPPCEVIISNNRLYNPESLTNVLVPVFTLTAPSREEFGVCTPPIFGYIPSTTLIEFIEMTKLLGASHIVFYAHQISREIQKVLQHYHQQGSITVIHWDLPVTEKHIWYHGQLLAINDCLYRNMHRFQYLTFNDLDEFIVPHTPGVFNWTDMMKVIDKASTDLDSGNTTTRYSGYSFLSAFFDPLSSGSRVLYDLESDLRTKSFSSVRSKCMVIPERMFELGIHHMSRPISKEYKAFYVQSSVSYIHHYRQCVMHYDQKMNCQVFARDESLLPYIPRLRHNVQQKLWTLKEIEKKHARDGKNVYIRET